MPAAALVPNTIAGAKSSPRSRAAASSACSPIVVDVQPGGRGLRELPGRS
jgi:hypothetical protein